MKLENLDYCSKILAPKWRATCFNLSIIVSFSLFDFIWSDSKLKLASEKVFLSFVRLFLFHGNCSHGAHFKKAKSGSEFFASVVKLFIFSCLKPKLKRSCYLHHPQPFLLLLSIAGKDVSVHLYVWDNGQEKVKDKYLHTILFDVCKYIK